MLDDVPVDIKGGEGVERDEAGKQLMAERSQKKLTPAKRPQQRWRSSCQNEADADKPLFPSVSLPNPRLSRVPHIACNLGRCAWPRVRSCTHACRLECA